VVATYYYYFIFASQHDPLAPLSRETGTPHSAGEQWRDFNQEYQGGPGFLIVRVYHTCVKGPFS
jgi:hypothetical protein